MLKAHTDRQTDRQTETNRQTEQYPTMTITICQNYFVQNKKDIKIHIIDKENFLPKLITKITPKTILKTRIPKSWSLTDYFNTNCNINLFSLCLGDTRVIALVAISDSIKKQRAIYINNVFRKNIGVVFFPSYDWWRSGIGSTMDLRVGAEF